MSAAQGQELRIDEQPPGAGGPAEALDLSGLAGTWLNTDGGSSGGVLRFVVSDRDGRLYVRGIGVGDPRPSEWDEVEGVPFAPTVGESRAWAFNCSFDFGFLRTDVSAYNKQGILVAAIFNRFADGSGRSDYWTREFFYREALG